MNIFNLFIKQRNLGIRLYTDKKEKNVFLFYQEIQRGAVAKS
jgi:hypothetical protein